MTTFLILGVFLLIAIIIFNHHRKKKAQQESLKEAEEEIRQICNTKLKVKFLVTGWDHLDKKASEIQKNVEVGEKLELDCDENNKYDSLAIKVLKNGTQIGWYGQREPKKKQVFILVGSGKEFDAEVVETFPMYVRVTYNPQ